METIRLRCVINSSLLYCYVVSELRLDAMQWCYAEFHDRREEGE